MKKLRPSVLLGLFALLAGVGLGAAPGAAADVETAATCTHPSWSNKDSGVGSLRGEMYTAPIRTGPNEGCGVVGEAIFHMDIYYHCYVFNSAGNSWSHVRAYNRFDGKSISGWIWDGNLDGPGSVKPC